MTSQAFSNFCIEIQADGSMADTCKNCVKCSKSFKICTNEAYNLKIKISVRGILKIFSALVRTSKKRAFP